MSRIGAMEIQQEHFGNSMLPDICILLRMSVNGSGDPWPGQKTALTLNMLSDRIDSWEHNDNPIDAAVFSLVVTTVWWVKRELRL